MSKINRIGLCDDESIYASRLERLLPECEIVYFSNREELLNYTQKDELNLLLMDIELDKDSGIEIVKELSGSEIKCPVAFLTNYLNYATEVYDTEHCYYILKEQLEEKLPKVLEKVNQLSNKPVNQLILNEKGGKLLIWEKDILYLERRGRVTLVVTDREIYEVRETLTEILEELNPDDFVRCHNSFVIAFSQVKRYRRLNFEMKNGIMINISRTYIEPVRRAFMKWSGEQL